MNYRLYLAVLFFNCVISAFSQTLLKKAAQNECHALLKQYLNTLVIFGYSLFFVVLVLNVWLLRFVPLKVVSSVGESLPLILSFFSGWFFFGEKISLFKIVGAACVIVGVTLVVVK